MATATSPSLDTVVYNDLLEPVWCTMYEASAESSTATAYLGLGLSAMGLVPLGSGIAFTVGVLSLFLLGVGVYDVWKSAGGATATNQLFPKDAMLRTALSRDYQGLTTNSATLIRMHIENQKNLLISRITKSHLPRDQKTSDLFKQSDVHNLFSITFSDAIELHSFRMFKIRGLVLLQGSAREVKDWIKGPVVEFSRGEMSTISKDQKTFKKYGPLSVKFPDPVSIFRYDPSVDFTCVADTQTVSEDGYDFVHIGPRLQFLRLAGCTVRSTTRRRDIGFVYSEDTVNGLILKYPGYHVYWTEKRDDRQGQFHDYLCAAKFNPGLVIAAHEVSFRLFILVQNWIPSIKIRVVKNT
jgi:hypothetical protein